jgi:fatty acid desaturase (delta-4 desaturase)
MPPDANKLRQRKTNGGVDRATESTQTERIASLNSLKGNEVCIDGIIYNLDNFDHPGGDSIQIFGGNDVTIQYKMIHPYHTDKHLEKMKRVGKVADFVSE